VVRFFKAMYLGQQSWIKSYFVKTDSNQMKPDFSKREQQKQKKRALLLYYKRLSPNKIEFLQF
jgi:hypothetical protein